MGRTEKNGIIEGVIWRQLLAFFFPILLGTLFQQLYNTVDAVVVGRFAGKAALAAVGGSAAQILNLLIGFFVGLSSGATVIVSQFFGAEDAPGISRAVHTAMWLALAAGLGWSVLGVAVATALAQLAAALLVWVSLCRAKGSYRMDPRALRADRALLKRTVQIGLPAGLQSVMYALSNMIITATINGFGTSTVAAWVTLGKVDGMYWMINNAFGVSVMTFAGQNYGARRLDRAERSLFVCGGLNLAAAAAFSTAFFAFARPVYSLFTRDPEVIDIALEMMRHITPWYFLFVPIEMISGALRGMGRTLVPTMITAVGICVYRVIWMFAVVPAWHEIRAIAISYPISWVMTAAAFIAYYPFARRRLGFGRLKLGGGKEDGAEAPGH